MREGHEGGLGTGWGPGDTVALPQMPKQLTNPFREDDHDLKTTALVDCSFQVATQVSGRRGLMWGNQSSGSQGCGGEDKGGNTGGGRNLM